MERLGMLFLAVMLFMRAIYADEEGNALITFNKTVTRDPSGAMRDWINASDHCSWSHVTCDKNNKRVTEINITNMDLSAQLVEDFSTLTKLQSLELPSNHITGQIHPEFGKLSELVILYLANNNLIGPIPDVFNKLSNLAYLDLSNNQLSGEIPMTLFNDLATRGYINLSHNNLSGQVASKYKNNPLVNITNNPYLCYADPPRTCPS